MGENTKIAWWRGKKLDLSGDAGADMSEWPAELAWLQRRELPW